MREASQVLICIGSDGRICLATLFKLPHYLSQTLGRNRNGHLIRAHSRTHAAEHAPGAHRYQVSFSCQRDDVALRLFSGTRCRSHRPLVFASNRLRGCRPCARRRLSRTIRASICKPGEVERLRKLVPLLLPVAFIVVFDQLTKAWVRANLWDNPRTIAVIPSWLELTPVANRGVAFGLFQEAGPILGLAVVGTFAVLAVRKWRALVTAPPLMKVTMGLIAGGAIGNLIDRAYQGYVIDFVSVPRVGIFQVFNVADAAISVGTVLLFLAVWLPQPRRSAPEPIRADTSAPPESASGPAS